jgi:hypothetical protein
MARYSFDTAENGHWKRDDEGLELEDRKLVAREAQRVLPEMARDGLPDGPRHEFAVEVRDLTGVVIYRAALTFTSEWVVPPE